jgi:glycosyltransferase involved in cell wall biosynthesis
LRYQKEWTAKVTSVAFNGKFMSSPQTGVHRVAEELLKALDKLPVEGKLPNTMSLIIPASSRRTIDLSAIHERRVPDAGAFMRNILWEQFVLPFIARKDVLVSLCNLGPCIHPRGITMIHDAQVYLTPKSYSKPFRAWYKFIHPLIGRNNQVILTVSDYSKAQIIRYGLAPADKIAVIHNGCDHVLNIKPETNYIVAAGLYSSHFVLALSNTQAHKNIAVLLKAFALEKLSNVTLVLFGSATKADFEAKGLTMTDNVHFTGRISDTQMIALMQRATAFAMPSLTEGFGLPPLEAMRLGCPAIVSPEGALPESCGTAALYADAHQPSQWADSIRRLIDEPEYYPCDGLYLGKCGL